MAEINKIPQFNVAEFLAKRREASSRQTTGTNYVDLLRQGSAENQGYTTSSSFAGVQQPGLAPGQKVESAIGANFKPTPGTGNVVNNVIGTTLDVGQNVVYGAASVAEGLVDFLAGIAGGAWGLLGGKTEGFEDFIKARWSDDVAAFSTRVGSVPFEFISQGPTYFASIINDISSGRFSMEDFVNGKYSSTKYSLIDSNEPGKTTFIEDVAQGVGQLVPLIALTAFTGGTGGAAAAGGATTSVGGVLTAGQVTTIGIAGMSASAAGGGVESALGEGYDYGTAMLYGTATGAIEAATEIIGGKILKGIGRVTGVSSAVGSSTLAKRLLSTTLGRAAQAGLEEGFEEVVAEVGGSILDWAILQKEDAFKERLTLENLSRTFATSFVSSGLTNITFGQKINVNGKAMDRQGSDAFLQYYTFEQLNSEQNKKLATNLERAFQPLIQNNVLEADANGKYEAFIPGVGTVKFNVSETSVIRDYEINIDGKITQTQLNNFEKALNEYQRNEKSIKAFEDKLDAEYKRNSITQQDLDLENINKNIPESIDSVENEINDFLKTNKNINVDQNGQINFVGKNATKTIQKLQSLVLRKKTLQFHKEQLEAKFKNINDVYKKLQQNNWKNINITQTTDANGAVTYSPVNIANFVTTNRTGENAALSAELSNLVAQFPDAVGFVSGLGNAGQNVISLFDASSNLLYYADKYFENPRLTVKQLSKTSEEVAENVKQSVELYKTYAVEKFEAILAEIESSYLSNDLQTVLMPKNGKLERKYVREQVKNNKQLKDLLDVVKDSLGSKTKLSFKLEQTYFTNPALYNKFLALVSELENIQNNMSKAEISLLTLGAKIKTMTSIASLDAEIIDSFLPSQNKEFYETVEKMSSFMKQAIDVFGETQKTLQFKDDIFSVKRDIVPIQQVASENKVDSQAELLGTMSTLDQNERDDYAKKFFKVLTKGKFTVDENHWDPTLDILRQATSNYEEKLNAWKNNGATRLPGADSFGEKVKLNSIIDKNVENLTQNNDKLKGRVEIITLNTLTEFVKNTTFTSAIESEAEKIVASMTEAEINEIVNPYQNPQLVESGQVQLPVVKLLYSEKTGEVSMSNATDKYLAFLMVWSKVYNGRGPISKVAVTVDVYEDDIPSNLKTKLSAGENRYIVNDYVANKENNFNFNNGIETNAYFEEVFRRYLLNEPISKVPFTDYVNLYKKAKEELKNRPLSVQEQIRKERSFFSDEERSFLTKLDRLDVSNSTLNLFNTLKTDLRQQALYGRDQYKGYSGETNPMTTLEPMFGFFTTFKDMLAVNNSSPYKTVVGRANRIEVEQIVEQNGGITIKDGNIVTYKRGYQTAFDKKTELVFKKNQPIYTEQDVKDGKVTQTEYDAKLKEAIKKNLDEAMNFVYDHSHTAKLLDNVGIWVSGANVVIDPSSTYVVDYMTATILQIFAEQDSVMVWENDAPKSFIELDFKQSYTYGTILVRAKGLNIESDYGYENSKIWYFDDLNNPPQNLLDDNIYILTKDQDPYRIGVYKLNKQTNKLEKFKDRKFLGDFYINAKTFLQNVSLITMAEAYGIEPFTNENGNSMEQFRYEQKNNLDDLDLKDKLNELMLYFRTKTSLSTLQMGYDSGSGFDIDILNNYLSQNNADGYHLDFNVFRDFNSYSSDTLRFFYTALQTKTDYEIAKKFGKKEIEANGNVVNIEENTKLFREYLKNRRFGFPISWKNKKDWDYKPLSDADQQELINLSNQNMEVHDSLETALENTLGAREYAKKQPEIKNKIVWVPIENLVKLQEFKRDGLWEKDASGSVSHSNFNDFVGDDVSGVINLIESILEKGKGLYQPIFLTYNDENGRLQVKDGNHRFSAMLALGMKTVPVILGVTKSDNVRMASGFTNFDDVQNFGLAQMDVNTNADKNDYFNYIYKQLDFMHAGFVKPEIQSPKELDSNDWLSIPTTDVMVSQGAGWGYLGELVLVNAKSYLPSLFDKQTVKPTYAPSTDIPFNAWALHKITEKQIEDFAEKENIKAAEQEKLRLDNVLLEEKKAEQEIEDKRKDFDVAKERNRVNEARSLIFGDNRDVFKVRKGKKRYYIVNPSINIENVTQKDVKEILPSSSGQYLLLSEEDYLSLKNTNSGKILNDLQPVAVDIDEAIANGERRFNPNVESIKKDDVLKAIKKERDTATFKSDLFNRLSGSNIADKIVTYAGPLYLNEVVYFDKYFEFAKTSISEIVGLEFRLSPNFVQANIDAVENAYLKSPKTADVDGDYALFDELKFYLIKNYEPDFVRKLGTIAASINLSQQDTLEAFAESLKQQRGPTGINDGQNEIIDFVVKVGNIVEKRRQEGVSISDYKENKTFIASLPNVDVNPRRLMNQFNKYSNNNMEFDAFIRQSGIYKWFDGPNWTKALRMAMVLYTQNQEANTTEAKLLLNRFIYDFGLLDFDKEIKGKGKTLFYPIKTKYLPTYYANIYDVLTSTTAAGEVNFLFQATGATTSLGWIIPRDIQAAPQITGFITSEGNVVSNDSYNIVVNKYDYSLGNVAIHELNHLLLRNKQPKSTSFKVAQEYVDKVIKIIDYIKAKGDDVYKDFIGMLAPSYGELYTNKQFDLDLRSYEITDLTTGKKQIAFYVQKNSIEEEAIGELIALNIQRGGSALIDNDPVLKSMVDDARKNFIAATILNKSADIKFDQTVKTTFAFNTDSNQAILNQLTNKIKLKPIEKKEPLKTRINTLFTKWQEALQDSAAPMIRAFEYFGQASVGDALLQQIRAATAITEQYILNGIFDGNTQLAKPLYSQDFSGKGIFDFLVREFTTDKFGNKIYKDIYDEKLAADFFLYNYLKHNVDSQNLKRKDVRIKDVKPFGALSGASIDNIILSMYKLTKNGKNASDISEVPTDFNPFISSEFVNELALVKVLNEDEVKEINNQLRYYITIFGKYISIGTSGLNADKIMPKKLLEDLETYVPNLFNALTAQGAMDEAQMEKMFREEIEALGTAGASRVDIDRLRSLLKQVRLFVQEVDMDTSKKFLKEMDAKYPNFAQKNKDLVKYFKVLFDKQLEAGLITQEAYEELNKTFPNYVPLSREYITGTASQGIMMKKMMSVRNPVMRRTGSDRVIEPLDITAARRTQVTNRAITINNLMNKLFDLWEDAGFPRDNPYIKDAEYFKAQRRTNVHDDISDLVPQFSGETITFFRKGTMVKVTVGSGLARTLENLTMKTGRELGIVGDSIRKLASGFKSLVTNWSIVFQIRNFFRDQFNSMILSSNKLGEVQARTPVSMQLILSGGNLTKRSAPMLSQADIDKFNSYFKEFRQNGGMAASLYSHDEGITAGAFYSHSRVKDSNKAYRLMRTATSKLTKVSMAIELLPRLSEYMASRDAGKSVIESINDSANVTTNFLKAGTFGRLLNTFGFTFLNANIQGKAHLLKRLVSPRSAKAWASFIGKFTIMGLTAALINEMLWGGDDDYEDLPDYVKEQNFLIKIGNVFIKIPKGQILSEINYFVNVAEKAEDPDWTVIEAFTQIDPFNGFRNIFSPFVDVTTNTTWYGGEIVGSRYDGIRPENQYSETTSSVAKWLGKTIGYSPLKVDYLLNTYGGILYDVFMSNNSIFADDGRAGFETFLANPRETNRWSSDFYKKLKGITWDKNDGDIIAQAQVRYMNRVKSNIQEVYQQMELINLDPLLGDAEKKQQIQVLEFMIANAYKQAVKNVDALGNVLQNYELSEESFDDDLLDAMKQIFGAEYALRNHDKKLHYRAALLQRVGFGFEDFYNYYYNIRMADSLELRFKYINRLAIPRQMKQVLYIQAGGRLKLEDKRRLMGLLAGQGLTEKEINELLKINEEAQPVTMSSFFTRQ